MSATAETTVLDLEILLKPVSKKNPVGEDLTYDILFDEIRTLRQPDESGETDVEAWRSIRMLTSQALSERSKHLQLAIWLLEAVTQLEGFVGLEAGLRLVTGLHDRYWKMFYPEIDKEDPDEPLAYRTGQIDWVADKLPDLVQGLPLCSNGYGHVHYQTTKKTGPERDDLTEAGWPTSEEFNEALQATPLLQLESKLGLVELCLKELEALQTLSDKLYVEAPADESQDSATRLVSFVHLREMLEECRWLVERAAAPQRQPDPKDEEPAPTESPPEAVPVAASKEPSEAPRATAPSSAPRPAQGSSVPLAEGIPTSESEAREKAFQVAACLRRALGDVGNKYHPEGYLLARAVVAGDLLNYDDLPEPEKRPAPDPLLRKKAERLYKKEQWQELLDECEQALAQEENWFWLDLHRYAAEAMENLDNYYTRPILGIKGMVRLILAGHPDLPAASLKDGTPAADDDTREWIEQEVMAGETSGGHRPAGGVPLVSSAEEADQEAEESARLWREAERLAASKQVPQALKLLQQRVGSARSGRNRFLRRLQMAEICLNHKMERQAYPILDELVRMIDEHGLEEWEDKQLVARTLANLVRCGRAVKKNYPDAPKRAQEVYERLCRLDIGMAMSVD